MKVVIDLGSTSAKCFWRDGEQEGWRMMPSHVCNLTPLRYVQDQYMADDNTSLIEVGDRHFIVGEQAKGRGAPVKGDTIKAETAIARVLAVVGGLCVENEPLSLAILLPMDEESKFVQIQDQLEDALSGFEFNGVEKAIALEWLRVYPEGAGIARFCSPEATILVFGHKDVNHIHTRQGSISRSISQTWTGWGTLKLIREMPGLVSRDDVATAQALYIESVGGKGRGLKRISGDESLQESFLQTRELIWSQYRDRLRNDIQTQSSEEIVATGGGSPMWYELLKGLFERKVRLPKQLIQDMVMRFPELKGKSMLHRGTDLYALWRTEFDIPAAPARPKEVAHVK